MYHAMIKSIHTWILTLCVGVTVFISAEQTRAGDSYIQPITSDSLAIARVNHLTGLGDYLSKHQLKEPSILVNAGVFRDTLMSEVRGGIRECSAWRILLSDFGPILNDLIPNAHEDNSERICEIWLDSLTGQLLIAFLQRIEPDSPSLDTLIYSEATSESEWFSERFHGLPSDFPKVDLLEALSKCGRHPLVASTTIIRYLSISQRASEVFPAWVIGFPGHGYKSTRGGEVAFSREVVDATTGKVHPFVSVGKPRTE